MAKIPKQTIPNIGNDVEQLELLDISDMRTLLECYLATCYRTTHQLGDTPIHTWAIKIN